MPLAAPVRFAPRCRTRSGKSVHPMKSFVLTLPTDWLRRFALAADDLLRDAIYRRLWISIFISSFGAQVTMLALPLTAAVLLHATPTQMGVLTAMEVLPFVLFSLPSGVYLDRVRKLPVYVWGNSCWRCSSPACRWPGGPAG